MLGPNSYLHRFQWTWMGSSCAASEELDQGGPVLVPQGLGCLLTRLLKAIPAEGGGHHVQTLALYICYVPLLVTGRELLDGIWILILGARREIMLSILQTQREKVPVCSRTCPRPRKSSGGQRCPLCWLTETSFFFPAPSPRGTYRPCLQAGLRYPLTTGLSAPMALCALASLSVEGCGRRKARHLS